MRRGFPPGHTSLSFQAALRSGTSYTLCTSVTCSPLCRSEAGRNPDLLGVCRLPAFLRERFRHGSRAGAVGRMATERQPRKASGFAIPPRWVMPTVGGDGAILQTLGRRRSSCRCDSADLAKRRQRGMRSLRSVYAVSAGQTALKRIFGGSRCDIAPENLGSFTLRCRKVDEETPCVFPTAKGISHPPLTAVEEHGCRKDCTP